MPLTVSRERAVPSRRAQQAVCGNAPASGGARCTGYPHAAVLNLNACGAERAPNAGGALVRIDGAVVVLINLEPVDPVL